MFLGIYRFEGPTSQLLPKYEKLVAGIPPQALHLHTCVVDDQGLWIYDCCPSRDAFEVFAASPSFQEAVLKAGLPTPAVSPIGEVHAAFVAGNKVI